MPSQHESKVTVKQDSSNCKFCLTVHDTCHFMLVEDCGEK